MGVAALNQLVAGTVLLCAALGLLNAQTTTTPPARVVLEAGDYVRVSVFRKPEYSGEFLIAADGTLKHPLFQDVVMAGQPVSVGLERLRTFLLKYETAPQVSIEPLFQVTVGGEVRNPNLFRLSPEITIAQAVAQAGGPTERGRPDHVRLLRHGREHILDLSGPVTDAVEMTVASGDRIIVGRTRESRWRFLTPLASVLSLAATVVIIMRQ